jgi:hypothetical protein
MIENTVTASVFTVLFGVLFTYLIVRLLIDYRRPIQAIGHLLHAVMSLDMAVMSWPVWFDVSAIAQLFFFALAALWFASIATLQLAGKVTRKVVGRHGAGHQFAHAIMMFAMLWMVVAMVPTDTVATDTHSHDHMQSLMSAPMLSVGILLVVALLVTAVIQVVELTACLRGGERTWFGHTGDLTSGVLMSFGMAAMTWLMLGH